MGTKAVWLCMRVEDRARGAFKPTALRSASNTSSTYTDPASWRLCFCTNENIASLILFQLGALMRRIAAWKARTKGEEPAAAAPAESEVVVEENPVSKFFTNLFG